MKFLCQLLSVLSIVEFARSASIYRWSRLKRANVFDPSLPAYPGPNTPFYQPPPYPLPTATIAPSSVFMPVPPKNTGSDSSDNPYLDTMHDPINPNYGLGLSALQPTIFGGNLNFPTGSLLRPQETVGGTFGFARPINVRFGTQGGPFFPWQDPNYAKSIKKINEAQAESEAFRRDFSDVNKNYRNDQPLSNVPMVAPPILPPLPPNYRHNS